MQPCPTWTFHKEDSQEEKVRLPLLMGRGAVEDKRRSAPLTLERDVPLESDSFFD